MKIDFFNNHENDSSSSESYFAYKLLMDKNMHCIKMQAKHKILYIKWLGIFILASLIFYLMQSKSSIVFFNYLIGIVFVGIASLIVCLANIFRDFEYDRQIIYQIKEGKKLERENTTIFSSEYFHSFDKAYRPCLMLIPCIFPLGLIAIITASAGFLLSIKINVNLAIGVGICSLSLIIAGLFFLIKFAKSQQQKISLF